MSKIKHLRTEIITSLLLLILAYANHFQNDFHFDDSHTIQDNTAIRHISNIPAYFTDPTMFSANPKHQHLRPLVTTTLAIDYWLGGGLYLFFFHLSTFLWHIGLCVLLFFIYRKVIRSVARHPWVDYIALAAASLFSIHTAIAETVNYIIARSDVLSTFFIALSVFLYTCFPQKRKWGAYILAAVAGIFAKETVPVLLIILFFYIALFEKKLSVAQLLRPRNFKTVGRIIVSLIPLLVAIAVVQIYTLTRVNADTKAAGLTNPLFSYWLTQAYVWFRYFAAFFFPFNLSADTDLSVIPTFFDYRILIGLLFVLLLVLAIFKTSEKEVTRPVCWGLIWFAASLLPTSLLPFAEVMNDHRMYFAFTGLSLSVVYTAGLFLIKKEKAIKGNKQYLQLTGVCIALFWGLHAFGVHQRNKVWHTEESLWYDVTQKSPGNGRGWMNYGLALMGRGDYTNALNMFRKAEELLPAYSTLAINTGIANGAIGNKDEAERNFNKAIFLAPDDYNSYSFYARYLARQGNWAKAKTMADKGLALNPKDLVSLKAAMAAYQGLALWEDLQKTALYTLTLAPGDAAAQSFLEAAKKRTPATAATKENISAETYINLSLVLYNAGKYEECIEACNKALALKPDNADAYSNICAAYNSLGQWDKAEAACKKALQINPDHSLAKGNLQWALKKSR